MIAFTLQLSGVGHAVADALALAEHEAHEEADCSEGGSECPPGCPGCHCGRMGSAAAIPSFAQSVQFATNVEFGEPRQMRPPQPAADQLYRPPRA